MSASLLTSLQHALPAPLWQLILRLIEVADANEMALFTVGGPVRDLLLDVPLKDIDFVVEGDARQLARQLKVQLGGELVVHDRFQTATWQPNAAVWEKLGLEIPTTAMPPLDLPPRVPKRTLPQPSYPT